MSQSNTSNLLDVGYMNARTGSQAGNENSVLGIKKKSKDLVCNARGLKLIDLCNSYGLRIQNGTSLSDMEGQITFVRGQGSYVIDYSLVGEWNEHMIDMKIETVPYSDHFPMIITFGLISKEAQESKVINSLPKLKWKPTNESLISHC